MVAGVGGAAMLAQQRALELALERQPVPDRAVYASFFGIPRGGAGYESGLDPVVARALARLSPEQPVRAMQFRLTRIGGSLVNLGAVDDVGGTVTLRNGRLPRVCRPDRCEVVQLAGSGRIPSVRGIRLVRVGTGSLRSPLAFARLPGAEGELIGDSARLPSKPPFVIAAGVAAVSRLPELASAYRTYVWALPVGPESVRPWDVERFARGVERARAAVEAESVFFDVTAPLDDLRAAATSSRVAARRLMLVGGQAAVLLLAFAVFAAAQIRSGLEASSRRLTWFGARPWQVLEAVAAELAVPVAVGVAVGWCIGAAVIAAVAGEGASPILRHSILSPSGLAAAAVTAVATLIALLLAVRAPALAIRGRAVSPLDVAAAGAIAVVAVAVARGSLDSGEVARTGATGGVLLLVPGLVAFAAAVALARALSPMMRALERLARRGGISFRLAALSLARRSGTATVATAFLAVSLGLAAFAATYRETLDRGRDDQARYAAPTEVLVRERLDPSGLVAPLEAAPLERYAAVAAGDAHALAVRRTHASVARGPSLTLLALPAGRKTAPRLDGWRADFARASLPDLLAAIAPERREPLRGPSLPRNARRLTLRAAFEGDAIVISATVLMRNGRFASLRFVGGPSRTQRASVPEAARGGTLLGFELATDARTQHGSGVLDGTLRLGRLTAETPAGPVVVVPTYRRWIGREGIRVVGDGTLRYIVTDQSESRFRPRQPREAVPVPAIVTPRLAATAADGVLPLRLPRGTVRVAVAGVARRFPGLAGEFAVADGSLLSLAVDADEPGAALPNEVWFDAPSPRSEERLVRALARPPFDRLELRTRAALADELRRDPLARTTLVTLAVAALAALGVALLGVFLMVVSDVRDEGGELADLEVQGLAPRRLRSHVRARAAVVGAVAGAAAVALGLILARTVTSVVALTASGGSAEPPLLPVADWAMLAAASAAFAAAATAVVVLATSRSLGGGR